MEMISKFFLSGSVSIWFARVIFHSKKNLCSLICHIRIVTKECMDTFFVIKRRGNTSGETKKSISIIGPSVKYYKYAKGFLSMVYSGWRHTCYRCEQHGFYVLKVVQWLNEHKIHKWQLSLTSNNYHSEAFSQYTNGLLYEG